MHQRPNMRIGARQPKLEWKTIAISDTDPSVFAQSLQEALQELSDGGYNILMQLTRGTAHIILANRLAADEPSATLPPPPPLRRVRHPHTGRIEEVVTYHWLHNKESLHATFPSLLDALRLVRQHVNEDAGVLPAYLVATTSTTFEASSFPMLLHAYSEELTAPPPMKQVD